MALELLNYRAKASLAAAVILMLSAAASSSLSAVPLVQEPAQSTSAQSSGQQALSGEQIADFLLNAKIIGAKQSKKGITSPPRLTLSDGTLTHDASFQSVDESEAVKKFEDGRTELNFRDSYHYNIAAYEVAKLLGLEDMIPVTVERKWEGKLGSLSWWLPVMMDEGERLQKNLRVPDVDAWNNQMYKVRVFCELVYDTDRNLTNILIGNDWKIYMIDFTRAFRLRTDLKNPKNLVKCDRHLLDKLRQLSADAVTQRAKGHLKKSEITALMARRDKIVSYFQKLIAEQGENAVLY